MLPHAEVRKYLHVQMRIYGLHTKLVQARLTANVHSFIRSPRFLGLHRLKSIRRVSMNGAKVLSGRALLSMHILQYSWASDNGMYIQSFKVLKTQVEQSIRVD